MSVNHVLAAGDKVELFAADDERAFKTVVWEVFFDGAVLVALPVYGSIPMLIHEGDEISLVYFRESGRYTVQTRAAGFLKKDEVTYARLVRLSEPIKSQRREFFRLPVRLDVAVCKCSDDGINIIAGVSRHDIAEVVELETAETKDLSVTGVAIESKKEYKSGEKYLLQISLSDISKEVKPIEVHAEVVRKSYDHDRKKYMIGMRFYDQAAGTSEFLAKYVLARQQKQIMRKRLVEGNLE